MNVNKETNWTIAMNNREMEALFYFMRIVNNIIESEWESDNLTIPDALDFTIEGIEDHQDYMIEFIDELKFNS